MTPRRIVELVAFLAVLLLAALSFHAWLASHDDQLRLQSVLASQKQLLDAADAREHDRQASLKDTLAQIEALKRSTQTPAQILRELPQFLSLPQPITLAPSPENKPSTSPATAQFQPSSRSSKGQGSASPEATSTKSAKDLPTSPSAQIPAADLKPLFDYVQDCRACQAQLAAAREDAADNAAKIGALTRERDAAITAAKGGGFWRRLRRNAMWFAVGAGAAALCSSGHCR